jgi:hypothetical protein
LSEIPQGGHLCRRKQLSIIGRLPSTIPTLPDTTKKLQSITTVGITRKRHTMLTPQAVTPTMPEITPKKREKLIPRSTARSNTPEPKHETATNPALGAPGGVARQGKPLLRLPATYRSGRSPDRLKMKNPAAPAGKREEEEDWSKEGRR